MPGVTISHEESLLAVKFSARPDPVFVTFTIAGAGSFANPVTAVKLRLVCESVSTGAPPLPPLPPPHAASAAQSIATKKIPAGRFIVSPFIESDGEPGMSAQRFVSLRLFTAHLSLSVALEF